MVSYRDEHMGRLLQSVYRDFNSRMLLKMHSAGYEDLTQFQAELISYMELDGTRIKSLTLKTGTSKQAVGEAVAQLVATGYIKKKPNPTDKRVQQLHFTTLGEQFLLDEHRLKAELEQDYMKLLGRHEFENLQKNLHIISSRRR